MTDAKARSGEILFLALGNPGEGDHNTIVLAGLDVVIPIEMDVDGDPFQDDEVRLRSASGAWERVLFASDDDVKPDLDRRMLFYRFSDVPYGLHDVSVRIAGQWSLLIRGIRVGRDGAWIGGRQLDDALPEPAATAGEEQPVFAAEVEEDRIGDLEE